MNYQAWMVKLSSPLGALVLMHSIYFVLLILSLPYLKLAVASCLADPPGLTVPDAGSWGMSCAS